MSRITLASIRRTSQLFACLAATAFVTTGCPAEEDEGPDRGYAGVGNGGNPGGSGGAAGGGAGGGGTGGVGGSGGVGGAGGGGGAGGTGGLIGGESMVILAGSGFDAPDLAVVTAKHRWVGDPTSFPTTASFVTDGAFEIQLRGALSGGQQTEIVWFLDLNEDLLCGGDDPAGIVPVTGELGPVRVAADPASRDPAACAALGFSPFVNVDVEATGFGAFEGAHVVAALVDRSAVAARARSEAIVLNGSFLLEFPEAQPANSWHEVHVFVDLDGDRVCLDEVGETHWIFNAYTLESDLVLPVTPATAEPSPCRNF